MATIVRPLRSSQRAPAPLPADVRWMQRTATTLTSLAVAALFLLAVLWLARQPMFTVRGIEVDGDVARNSEATIRANAMPKLVGTFFTLDLKAAQRAFESVPWVRHAIVQRIWPNRLAVHLEEHRPAAIWSPPESDTRSGDKLVNTFGEVFEANLGDVEDDELPVLSGPEGQAATMLEAHTKLAPLFARIDRQIDTLGLSGRGSWRAELDNGARIELGRGTVDELITRGERFVSTVAQVTSRYQRPVEYADLRHHDGYALRLKGVSTTPSPAAKPPGK